MYVSKEPMHLFNHVSQQVHSTFAFGYKFFWFYISWIRCKTLVNIYENQIHYFPWDQKPLEDSV